MSWCSSSPLSPQHSLVPAGGPRHGVQQRAWPGEPLTFVFLLSFQSWTHNIQREKEFLRKLVKARVITDLTSGI